VRGGELFRPVRGQHADDAHPGVPPRPHAGRRVLEDHALRGLGAELARREEVALRVGLAAPEPLRGDEDGGRREAGGADP